MTYKYGSDASLRQVLKEDFTSEEVDALVAFYFEKSGHDPNLICDGRMLLKEYVRDMLRYKTHGKLPRSQDASHTWRFIAKELFNIDETDHTFRNQVGKRSAVSFIWELIGATTDDIEGVLRAIRNPLTDILEPVPNASSDLATLIEKTVAPKNNDVVTLVAMEDFVEKLNNRELLFVKSLIEDRLFIKDLIENKTVKA